MDMHLEHRVEAERPARFGSARRNRRRAFLQHVVDYDGAELQSGFGIRCRCGCQRERIRTT